MEPIDFIVTWVDGSDPVWLEEKEKYVNEEQSRTKGVAGENRYNDNGLLCYWFRGVEKFAPWVNKIYFVTYGHLPNWLNINNPKLVVVKHEDFLPDEYRPTFNSNTITLNLHRIPGLSERFVYFNDDMFLVSPCEKEVFFQNGLPTDMAVQDVIPAVDMSEFWYMYFNNTILLNQNYRKKDVIKKSYSKWFSFKYGKYIIKNMLLTPISLFTGIYETHTPSGYLKSSFSSEWKKNYKLFNETSLHKVRNYKDVTEWYIRYAQMANGNFEPMNRFEIGRYCSMKSKDVLEYITSGKYKYICINDEVDGDKFKEVVGAFQRVFPDRSSFEVDE